jgi:hypothetical protein
MPGKLLITFGCSWTYGVGVSYHPGMSAADDSFWDLDLANSLSFRGIISKKLNYTNKNFSIGASSNQMQFRLAKEYFSSNEFDRDREYYSEIVVLWCITSIYRDELYSNLSNSFYNIMYSSSNVLHSSEIKIHNQYIKYFFDDNDEIRKIALDILFWDKFFSKNDITNYWFDTFNHLDYTVPLISNHKKSYNKCAGSSWPQWEDLITQNIDHVDPEILNEIYDTKRFPWARLLVDFPGFNNFIDFNNKNRDLASYLARHNGLDNLNKQIHTSNWEADTDCIKFLAKVGIVNPYSFHPTQRGHQQLADYFIAKIKDCRSAKVLAKTGGKKKKKQ